MKSRTLLKKRRIAWNRKVWRKPVEVAELGLWSPKLEQHTEKREHLKALVYFLAAHNDQDAWKVRQALNMRMIPLNGYTAIEYMEELLDRDTVVVEVYRAFRQIYGRL
jgi:hypothetical protein